MRDLRVGNCRLPGEQPANLHARLSYTRSLYNSITNNLAGSWRWIHVAGAAISLYLNVFVGVVQAFQKLSPFNALAPTQTEPPFLIAQVAVLLAFIGLGFVAARKPQQA